MYYTGSDLKKKNSSQHHLDYNLAVTAFSETKNLTINKRTSFFIAQNKSLPLFPVIYAMVYHTNEGYNVSCLYRTLCTLAMTNSVNSPDLMPCRARVPWH